MDANSETAVIANIMGIEIINFLVMDVIVRKMAS